MNIFDFLNNLTRNKIIPDFSSEEVEKAYSPYMINRFLSMFDQWLPIVQLANKYNFDKKTHYIFLFNLLPQVSVSFNNYISKKKNEIKEEEKELLLKYFQFGRNDLEYALNFLSQDQIACIIKKYKEAGKIK